MRKMYYSIKEAAEAVDLPAHVLRYWESEFKELKPRKNKGGHRVYREADIELLLEIKELLHDRRFTLEGARSELKRRRQGGPSTLDRRRSQAIRETRKTIRDILDMLGGE